MKSTSHCLLFKYVALNVHCVRTNSLWLASISCFTKYAKAVVNNPEPFLIADIFVALFWLAASDVIACFVAGRTQSMLFINSTLVALIGRNS